RLQKHAQSALMLAEWLAGIPQVRTVFHPALPADMNHTLWKRDATGSNGLLTIEFDPTLASELIENAIDQLQHFGIGSSWGGFESLVLPVEPAGTRLRDQSNTGYLLRLHIGLEDPEDLKNDLAELFRRLH